uniref:Retrotransposon gag domain-containing protein n=1 Tax=Fagus sylvatica TaxID=28930 RepID=A0A2N9HL80_FAGSY
MSEGNEFAKMLGHIKSSMKHIVDRLQKLEDHQMKTHEEENVEVVDLDKIEKNKDYTKFTEEIKGKVDLKQKTLRKNQGFDDYLFSMGGMATEPSMQQPPKVSIPEADKYNGSGDPKQHLRQYLSFVKMKGLNEIQVLNAFPFSLTGSASKWYYTLDMGKVKGWTELVNAFLTQFSFNTMIDIMLRDLDTTKQKERETFSEYLVRWREKASKMINRLGEKDQKSGHSTDECFHLQNDIQDLIDKDIIPKPNPPTMPNIHQNPLPNYQRVLPPNQLNYIEEEEFIFAIDDEVWMNFYKPTNGDSCHSTRIGKHFKPPHLEVEHPDREGLEREVPNDALRGALAEKEVPMTTSPKEVLSIMGEENVGVIISFTDKDLPPDGARHNRALYITVECLKAKVPRVLVDNGSKLNVCPFKTATTLGIKRDQISPSSLTIRTCDNSNRSVMGTFKVPCKIGPVNAIVVFHILNIPTSYNLLLGKAWMHPLGKFGQGITEPIKVHTQEATCKYGLGYKGDMKIIMKNKKTPNGNFVKAGESFPYCGFLEPCVKNEEKLLGLEIFFSSKLTLKDTLEEEDTKAAKTEAKDLVDYLGPKAMRLFDGDVLMLEDDEAAIIVWARLVQISEIYAHFDLAAFLRYWDYISNPISLADRLDESCFQLFDHFFFDLQYLLELHATQLLLNRLDLWESRYAMLHDVRVDPKYILI